MPDDDNAPALELYLRVVRQTPGWVNRLMALRNWMAGLVGLKNLGHLARLDAVRTASDYRMGDRVGIFSLLYLTPGEVLLGDSDKHLDVVLSVCKTPRGAIIVGGGARPQLAGPPLYAAGNAAAQNHRARHAEAGGCIARALISLGAYAKPRMYPAKLPRN
ncbi:DUF2867 domain-containing protein [Pseudoduganella guangdongensis]|uniref:DUF2867 domain-containing protein n=1 Tax=Pseudoduganella guangdongensis TaxID=2692179 RepID=UPI0021A3E358|nr:DUF2867 domain-containing protein [Pseudoduganella guangdongensis]